MLVPRPDTETLVDEAPGTAGCAPHGGDQSRGAPRVADVGTGSGAVAIAIATDADQPRLGRQPTWGWTRGRRREAAAADRPRRCAPRPRCSPATSAGALEVARRNAERHGAAITFVEGDLDQPLQAHAPFDLISANLPYIPSADIAGLAPEVRARNRGWRWTAAPTV